MKYKVKSRYRTLHEGDDPQKALAVYQAYRDGGMTNIKMTPDLSAKGFIKDFQVLKNKLIFSSDYAAYLVNKYLKRYETPVELIGKEIVVLNDKFLSKIVYLTEELFKNSAEITKLAKNKLGITNDVKKYRANLENGKSVEIFAFSSNDAREQAKNVADSKIKNIKEIKDGE